MLTKVFNIVTLQDMYSIFYLESCLLPPLKCVVLTSVVDTFV